MTEKAFSDADGIAALGICESLLLALIDLKILSEEDARDLLSAIATAHDQAAIFSQASKKNRAVMEIVRRILAGKNEVRH